MTSFRLSKLYAIVTRRNIYTLNIFFKEVYLLKRTESDCRKTEMAAENRCRKERGRRRLLKNRGNMSKRRHNKEQLLSKTDRESIYSRVKTNNYNKTRQKETHREELGHYVLLEWISAFALVYLANQFAAHPTHL